MEQTRKQDIIIEPEYGIFFKKKRKNTIRVRRISDISDYGIWYQIHDDNLTPEYKQKIKDMMKSEMPQTELIEKGLEMLLQAERIGSLNMKVNMSDYNGTFAADVTSPQKEGIYRPYSLRRPRDTMNKEKFTAEAIHKADSIWLNWARIAKGYWTADRNFYELTVREISMY